ncbi:MAG: hypothetical protein U5K72_15540 [Balneolaceae bacterium]|nr:hypothetical protein [Balneolaceae bacterium]
MDEIIKEIYGNYACEDNLDRRKKDLCTQAAEGMACRIFGDIDDFYALKGMGRIAFDLVTKEIPGAPGLAAKLVEAPTRAAYEKIRKEMEGIIQKWWQSKPPVEKFHYDRSLFGDLECSASIDILWNKKNGKYLYYISGSCGCELVPVPGRNRPVKLNSFQVFGGGSAKPVLDMDGDGTDNQNEPKVKLKVTHDQKNILPDCYCDENDDNIDSAKAEFNPEAGEPSDDVTITLTAKDAAGRDIDIHGVDIAGLDTIMEEGADYNVITALPAKNVEVKFTIAEPRKDQTYGLDIQLTDFEGVTTTINPDYEVLNVEPEIVPPVVNNSTSADPGETMALDGVEVTVIDRNADKKNESELTINRIKLSGQPEGLQTIPEFSEFDITCKSFAPETGTYLFELSRSARVNNPHEHGSFQNEFTIWDDQNEEVNGNLYYEVNNVPPVIERTWVEPRRFLHSGKPIEITVHALVRDDNTNNDIHKITIDASKAAADKTKIFERNDGLQEKEQDESRILFTTEAFKHTREPDNHPIPITVTDHPDQKDKSNTVESKDFIHVGNEEPEIGATGYIWGGNEEQELTITQVNRRVCPGEEITVGVRAADPEGDPLKVTATLNGNEIELEVQPGGTNTGTFKAPGPGEYTIRFDAQERVFDKQFAEASSLHLTVDPCEEEDEEEQTEDQQVASDEPVKDLPEEPNPQPNSNTDWDFNIETFRVGFYLGYETRYNLKDEACNQEELDRCEAANGSPSFGLFAEIDAINNLKLPGTNTDLSIAMGFRSKRSSTDFRQMYNQGSGYPYMVDGSLNFTSAGFYSRFSAPIKDGFPMEDSEFEASFNIGFNYTWNKVEFKNQSFSSGDEVERESRSHQNLNFTTGAGVNVNWNQKIGTGLGVYWGTDGGGADALGGIRASINYNF